MPYTSTSTSTALSREPETHTSGRADRLFMRFSEWLGRRNEKVLLALFYACCFVPILLSLHAETKVARFNILAVGWSITFLVMTCTYVSMMITFKRAFLLRQTRSMEALRLLQWGEFEAFCAALFQAEGYEVERRGGTKGDGGIDIILRRDGKRTCVQCKHWNQDKLMVQPVRELYGIMARDGYDGAIFIISGLFSPLVEEEFEHDARMQLIDGAKIVARIETLRASLPEGGEKDEGPLSAMRALIEKALPPADEVIRPGRCPHCQGVLELAYSKDTKERFWGCPNYNKGCRHTRSLSPFEKQILDPRRSKER